MHKTLHVTATCNLRARTTKRYLEELPYESSLSSCLINKKKALYNVTQEPNFISSFFSPRLNIWTINYRNLGEPLENPKFGSLKIDFSSLLTLLSLIFTLLPNQVFSPIFSNLGETVLPTFPPEIATSNQRTITTKCYSEKLPQSEVSPTRPAFTTKATYLP